jgi:hypothetical protein
MVWRPGELLAQAQLQCSWGLVLLMQLEDALLPLGQLRLAPEVLHVAGLSQGPAARCGLLQLMAQQGLGLRQVEWLVGMQLEEALPLRLCSLALMTLAVVVLCWLRVT